MTKTIVVKINNYIKYNKKTVVIILIVFLCLYIISSFVKRNINPIIINTVEIKSKSLATRAINSAIADVMINSVVYDDLINIITDEYGNISMIQANSLEINNLTKDLSQTTEKKLDEYGGLGVNIPLGSFTGIPLFVGRGPDINLKVNPIGAVSCVFSSKFEMAGINQTIHKIYLTVNANIGVIVPLFSVRYLQQQEVLISEGIIVGQVPEVYLYSDNLDNLLNFVPY